MADYALMLHAIDKIADMGAVEAYENQRGHLARDLVESDAVGLAITTFMQGREKWSGTAGKLLELLARPRPVPKDWPSTPRGLGGGLRRVAPALRDDGIDIVFSRDKDAARTRNVSITRQTKE
jgi:hypothetical protein